MAVDELGTDSGPRNLEKLEVVACCHGILMKAESLQLHRKEQ